MTPISGASTAELWPAADYRQQQDTRAAQKGKDLSADDAKLVAELREGDRRVRSHEAAHRAAAGSLVRRGSFSYQTGPDGERYAVGGEVSIDTSAIQGKPAATILKMQQVKRAAMAPADPSPQDRRVAEQAASVEARARGELLAQAMHPAIKAYTKTTPASRLGARYF